MNEFLRMVHAILDAKYGTNTEEISAEWGIDLDELSDEELDELEEMGAITWVSAEDGKRTISTVECEEASGQGNVSEGPSEMLKHEPRDDGNYTVTFASENGHYATMDTGKGIERSMYKVGETVITQNPYTHEFVHEDYDGTPLYFRIQSIGWDGGDNTFRYLIGDNEEWISEEWLDKPMVSMMSKVFVEITTDEDGVSSAKVKAPKETGLQTLVHEFTVELSTNTYLDMMLSEDAATREHGKAMLTKMGTKASTTGEAQE